MGTAAAVSEPPAVTVSAVWAPPQALHVINSQTLDASGRNQSRTSGTAVTSKAQQQEDEKQQQQQVLQQEPSSFIATGTENAQRQHQQDEAQQLQEPTSDPTSDPTSNPTSNATSNPTSNPTSDPTSNPTCNPTSDLTSNPTSNPTSKDGVEQTTVFQLWTHKQRYSVLLVAACATLLLPFCDTIYLPALHSIQADLKTSQSLVTASVSIYLFAVGIAGLLWGPMSDKFGRRWPYIGSCAAFIAISIVCIFSPNIAMLVTFRALQGAAVGAFWAIGNGSISDVFPPEQRGTAAGIFMIPVLVGPILGPLVGGGLSQAFGWRSTFVCLTGLSGVIFVGIVFLLPETHHYFILSRLKAKDPSRAASITCSALVQKPTFLPPWGPLLLLASTDILPHVLTTLLFFASMFMSLTQFPIFLAQEPYNLSEGLIGVCYLPVGMGAFISSLVGGRASDIMSVKFPAALEARLLPGSVIGLMSGIPGYLLYGWALEKKMHLGVVLLAHFLIGVCDSVYLPCTFSYLTLKKQQQASAASAGVQSCMFVLSGVLTFVAVPAVEAIGIGSVFTIATVVSAAVGIFAFGLQIWWVKFLSADRAIEKVGETIV